MSDNYKSPYRSDGVKIYRDDIHVANWTKEGYECLDDFKNYRLAISKWAKKFAQENPIRFPSGEEGEVVEEPEVEEVADEPEDTDENEFTFKKRDRRSGGEKFDKKEVYLSEDAPEREIALGDLTPKYCQWYAETYDPMRFKQKYRNHIRQKVEPVWTIYNETVNQKKMSEEATTTQEATPTQATPETVLGSAGGDTPSPEAAPATETYINPDGSLKEGWSAQYPDLDGFNLDKFKSVDALAKSYAHLERQKGGSYYPQEDWNDEKVAAIVRPLVFQKGQMATNLKPEEMPEGVEWDEGYANAMAEIMHKYHIPARAAHDMVQADLAHRQGLMSQFGQQIEQNRQEAEQTLREEWGLKYDANLESAQKAFQALARETGLESDQANEIAQRYGNEPNLLKMFAKVGHSIQDAAMHGLSRSQADSFKGDRERLTELVQSEGYMKGDASTIREIDELTKRIAESESGKFA